MDKSSVHHRANTETDDHTQSLLRSNHDIWDACFWTVGSWSTQREPPHAQMQCLNQEPSCCEATVLITTSQCSPYVILEKNKLLY